MTLRCFHCGKTQAQHTDADDKRCPMWGRYRSEPFDDHIALWCALQGHRAWTEQNR